MQNKDRDGGAPLFLVVRSAGEAEEHLKLIRTAMERSTKHSTLSGLSGILAGLIALVASILGQTVVQGSSVRFVLLWSVTLALAATIDIVLTKRRAARVGKTAFSPLGKQLARAVAPGLLVGLALTGFYLLHPETVGTYIYGFWMLCYASSLLAIGMFSLREVSVMGWAFLAVGTLTLLLPPGSPVGPRALMAVTFGGFHIVYGAWMGFKYGW